MSVCVFRLEANDGAIFRDGPVQVVFLEERVAEVVVRECVVRLEANGGAVFRNRPIQVALLAEREAELVVRRCVARLEALGQSQSSLHKGCRPYSKGLGPHGNKSTRNLIIVLAHKVAPCPVIDLNRPRASTTCWSTRAAISAKRSRPSSLA